MDKNVYHLKLISTGGAVTCDCHCLDGHSIWMTREQLGTALGFSNPGRAIAKYHARHRDVIEPLTIKVPLKKSAGGEQETYLYSDEAIMEICRRSKTPFANALYDFMYDTMDKYFKGQTEDVFCSAFSPKTNEIIISTTGSVFGGAAN